MTKARFLLLWTVVSCSAGSLACTQKGDAPAVPASTPAFSPQVKFRDRSIDLTPFVQGFPYKTFSPDYDSKRFFYFKEDEKGSTMLSLPLPDGEGAMDLAKGKPVLAATVDWNTRSYWAMKFHPASNSMILWGDEKNDEHMNLFRLSLADGSLSRITDKPYIYGYGFDKAKARLAYLPRYGTTEPYKSCVNLMDPMTGKDEEVACDSPAWPLTWADPTFRPDGSGLVVQTNLGGDRAKNNLLWLDLAAKKFEMLTDVKGTRNTAAPLDEWVDANRFMYVSDESGFTELYLYDLAKRTSKALTSLKEEIGSYSPLVVDGKAFALLILKRPYETEAVVVDPRSGKIVFRETNADNVAVLDWQGGAATIFRDSVTTYQKVEEWRFTGAAGKIEKASAPRLEPPADLLAKIDQCAVERVQIPTFDLDPKTKKARELHAYLYSPKNPPADPRQRFALITSFYGGENVWDMKAEIVCAAGGMALSPAVRGSDGFGREFFSLNDKDLGGNEIVDVIEAGKWLAKRFGLGEKQVGVWGASHGGYATMRALTFPAGVNGRTEKFDFGFGLAHAGFSNILTFYETCNIPDWVKLEAGDPVKEKDKLLDRSPVSHVDLLKAPLLLTHGENDNRVPVRESRQFAEKAKALGKPVTYVEFAGQGHGLKGIENQQKLWQTRFSFLQGALD